MARDAETNEHRRLQLGWLIAVVLAVVLAVGYLVACMIAQSLDGTKGHWWWLWSYKFKEQGSWFDVARTTAALVAIPGAAVALAITYARHHATERQLELAAAESRALEAREIARRVNEQYVQAVDQLQGDSPVARIAGMHALDRLAQDQADLRSIVVDVWCAYLRIGPSAGSGAIEPGEREVRATCTRLLLSHLLPANARSYWGASESISVDLTGADLTAYWDARGRYFPSRTRFAGARFGTSASFERAEFGSDVTFEDAVFARRASFERASFGDSADFYGAKFGDSPTFWGATFGESAWFARAEFSEHAWFIETIFGANSWFGKARLGDGANFTRASFGDGADFQGARFGTGADLQGATFSGVADFVGVIFEAAGNLADMTLGEADFSGAKFGAHEPRGDGTWWLREQPDSDETPDQKDAVPA